MSPGKPFELRKPTGAIENIDGKRVAIAVPQGAVVKIMAGPNGGDDLLDVLWEGRVLVMFAVDLREIGKELAEDGAGARPAAS